ncbi:hypothetical protein BASA81_006536 [Batrachochytrium salamandrivorans]|nr:hypothetical protein BASA81_006536 [Batrachochytrium salamandrivorans]
MDGEEEEELSGEEGVQKRPKLDVDMPFTCLVEVPFATCRAAEITKQTLEVDAELTPDKVRRTLLVRGSVLVCSIESAEQRLLRASLASFFDMAMTATRFLCEFDSTERPVGV